MREDEEILFHRHRERNGAISEFIRDLGSENIDEHRAIAFRERLAENLRLLYVALTRARNRCYLVWGGFKQAGTSAPAWLFHRPAGEAMDPKEVLDARFNSLDDAAMLRDLERLVAQSLDGDGRPSILLTPIPQQFPQPYRPDVDTEIALQPREFSGVIRRDWRIGSFSTLTAGRRDELPDYDPIEGAAPVPLAAETKPAGIFAFPRGTAPGTCLHKVFEGLDFTQADGAMEPFVEETLRTHGFDARQFAPGVCEAIRRTLLVPLYPARPGFTLSSVTRGDRLNELEFYFPVKPFTPGLLAGGFKQFAVAPGFAERLERLGFKPARGFIKGFIDLVFRFDGRFYIVDWKSNWLGNRAEDYDSARMAKEMSEKLYPLQYHLYAVALHQYLALRLPGYDYEKNFGGVFYLFVRGIDPSRPELGVYRDRPASKLIEQLSGLLLPDREGTEA